ncbi:hypothetical protein L6452_33137 [Arctium lappa]|uniref:Uncharacterized protein n=1 Tax=Arctium lappa TaxID=4217 RepID=A0ACB8Z7H0_ARCLA|nr:hypothetical protein L6452_33137 [Arctium lappa]
MEAFFLQFTFRIHRYFTCDTSYLQTMLSDHIPYLTISESPVTAPPVRPTWQQLFCLPPWPHQLHLQLLPPESICLPEQPRFAEVPEEDLNL